jgi:histone-lysine N-methyltransferase SETMAR
VDGANLSKTKETSISRIAGEDEVNCFFDAESVIHRKFVPERQKVNTEFYVVVLDRLMKRFRRVRKAKFQSSERSFFTLTLHLRTLQILQNFLSNRKAALLHHPPYSPGLAPADYFLFP